MNFLDNRVAPVLLPAAARQRGVDPEGQAPTNREDVEANPRDVADINNWSAPQPLPIVPNCPSRMVLTDTERAWAVAIKQAIAQDAGLEIEFSDFDIVQIAMVDQDNVENSVLRAHALQALKQDYDVQDTLEHGKCIVQQCMDLLPGLFLSITYNPQEGHVMAGDITMLKKSVLTAHSHAETATMLTWYYILHAVNPDFVSMRQGVVMLTECSGFSWSENFKMGFFKRFWSDFGSAYPARIKTLKHYHTNMFFNILFSMGKPFMPKDVKDVFQVGCYSIVGRLDRVCLTPTPQAAYAVLRARIGANLERRYENAKSFSLDDGGHEDVSRQSTPAATVG